MRTIELITPCHNEEACIRPFYDEVKKIFASELKDYGMIITYVDDGSSDNTMKEIRGLVVENPDDDIRFISLSRNFGKESAMYAGLENCVGDYVVILDSDLQHPPKLIPQMLDAIIKEGYDCATARRVSRKGEPPIRSFLSRSFYHIFNRITAISLVPGATDFRMMKKNVAKAIVAMNERERFTKGIYSWIGFKNKWIDYKNVEREFGRTKWSIRGLARYSLNGFIAFATTPLRAAVYIGMLIVFACIAWILYLLMRYWITGDAIGNGITALTIIVLFLGGMIITILGVIGEYVARLYMEVKQRPVYFCRETNIDLLDDKMNA